MGQWLSMLSGTLTENDPSPGDPSQNSNHGVSDEYQSTKSAKVYQELIQMLDNKLRQTGTISRIEYVGSAYKGTRIDGSDVDNLFVKRDTSIRTELHSLYEECVFLEDGDGSLLDPAKTLRDFKGKVQRLLNTTGYNGKARLADNGPAIELRYNYEGVSFKVDLVFCYEVANSEMYTAKPPKGATGRDTQLWKFSTALDEKQMMRTIDSDNKVKRWTVRILKGLINSEPTLRALNSYFIEQSLYHILKNDEFPDQFWVKSNFKNILREMLNFMANALEKNSLSNYFNPSEKDVIPQMSDITRSNVYHRLRRLSREPALSRLMENIDEYSSNQ